VEGVLRAFLALAKGLSFLRDVDHVNETITVQYRARQRIRGNLSGQRKTVPI
jgi:hypothetical protein